MDTKICSVCKESKSVEEFNKHKDKKDGLQPACRFCSAKRSRDYYASNRIKHKKEVMKNKKRHIEAAKKFVWNYLLGHPCVDCGETDIVVLEFDHVTGEKDNCLSNGIRRGWSINRVKKEIDKCEVRCSNCHRRITAKRSNYPIYEFAQNLVGTPGIEPEPSG